jgi:hypothetical protein
MIATFAVVITAVSTVLDNQTVVLQLIIVMTVASQQCTAQWIV